MEMFDLLLDKLVPEKIAGVCVSGILEDEELAQVLGLLDQRCTIDEALTLVLNGKRNELETQMARQAMTEQLV